MCVCMAVSPVWSLMCRLITIQVWKSSLAVHWHITDPDSPVLEQFISVITTEASHIDIPTIKVRIMSGSYGKKLDL